MIIFVTIIIVIIILIIIIVSIIVIIVITIYRYDGAFNGIEMGCWRDFFMGYGIKSGNPRVCLLLVRLQ